MNAFFSKKFCLASLLLFCCISITAYLISPIALRQQNYSSIITDSGGILLGATIAKDDQWRFQQVEALPDKYITALIQFEDKRFFNHLGVDPLSIARAIKINIEAGYIVSGGSTITMQLARLLSGNRARTYAQKIQEALLAFKLEARLSKREILEAYANLAPFGGNTVGLSAANWRYFNTQLKDISWSQAALLAVLPNNPSIIHPGRNRQALLNKRNRLLKKLNSQGVLSALDLKLALLEALPEKPLPMPQLTSHLLDTLKKRFPEKSVYKSTINRDLQKHLVSLLNSYNQVYEKNNIYNLAAIVIDNTRQHTIAYVGNSTRSKLNDYAPSMDIAQRSRSSGSLFKPFLFAHMLEQGYLLPDSLIADIPSYYDGYNPKNYDRDYRGLVPAKLALSQSLNVPAVRMLQQYGVGQFKQDLQDVGLTTLWRSADDYGLSLILGGAETTLWEITNSFSRLALSAQGQKDANTEAQFFSGQAQTHKTFPLGQGASWLTLNALLEVNRPGVSSNWKDFSSSQKIAWKTGTSYGWHDAWAVGTNGRYTVGIWAGNANGEEARQLTGTQTSAPIMLDVFSFLEIGGFPELPRHALKEYEVCEIDSYLPAQDCKTKMAYAPLEANFSVSSQFHKRIHIDPLSGMRVHGLCEQVSNMRSDSYFIIPPIHAKYFSGVNVDIPEVPSWRPDCNKNLPEITHENPYDLEYPVEGAQVKIPIELDGKLGRLILKAHHKNAKAILYWHLDNQVLGQTSFIHEQEIAVNPGWHQITLVDNAGYKLSRWFKAI